MAVHFYDICTNVAIAKLSCQVSSYCSSQDSQLGKSNDNCVSPVVCRECSSTMKASQKG